MGGKVAMELALNYTNYIDKLIVVDIAPKIYAAHHQEVFKAMFGLNPTALKSRNEAEQILNNYELDWATKQFILKNLSINKLGNGYQWQVNLEAIHHNYEHILAHNYSNKKYNGQTLFIKGGLSDYINIAEFENYKQYFPKAELQIIENAGHWVHSDKPAELIKAVLQHLNK